jgi:gliding motility-associated-like protein
MTYTQSNNPLVTPLETTTYVVTGVSDLQGCPQKDSVKVTVLENDVWVPTVFSPNGDGKNDIFKILTGRTRFVKIQEFKIYNRWGTEIYNGKDVSQGWDGTYKGQPQDTGTYFYQIRVAYPTGRVGYLKGDFTLIR